METLRTLVGVVGPEINSSEIGNIFTSLLNTTTYNYPTTRSVLRPLEDPVPIVSDC